MNKETPELPKEVIDNCQSSIPYDTDLKIEGARLMLEHLQQQQPYAYIKTSGRMAGNKISPDEYDQIEDEETEALYEPLYSLPPLSGKSEEETAESVIGNLMSEFKNAINEKALAALKKYGYDKNDWRDNWNEADCRKEMMRHIEKGDPRDVAIYCAFMWYHNWSTATEKPPLRPLSEISDEDAIIVAKMLDFHSGEGAIVIDYPKYRMVCDKYNDFQDQKNSLRIYTDGYEIFSLDDFGNAFSYDAYRLVLVSQFLTKQGYALPQFFDVDHPDNGKTPLETNQAKK